MAEDEAAHWQRCSFELMEWQRFATGKESGPFYFPLPRSAAELEGQAQAIARERRVGGFCLICFVSPEDFSARQMQWHRKGHRNMRRPFMKERV